MATSEFQDTIDRRYAEASEALKAAGIAHEIRLHPLTDESYIAIQVIIGVQHTDAETCGRALGSAWQTMRGANRCVHRFPPVLEPFVDYEKKTKGAKGWARFVLYPEDGESAVVEQDDVIRYFNAPQNRPVRADIRAAAPQ